MENTPKTKNQPNNSTEELLFFTGVSLLILYFILASPATPNFRYNTTIFWMATTILLLTIAPDYIHHTTQQQPTKHKNTKTHQLHQKLKHTAQKIHQHLNPNHLLYAALILTITGTATTLLTGNITEFYFGTAYGLLMKAILTPTPKQHKTN